MPFCMKENFLLNFLYGFLSYRDVAEKADNSPDLLGEIVRKIKVWKISMFLIQLIVCLDSL